MARREYRILLAQDEYYPQVHAGWRTLWGWRYIYMDNAYASRACPRATIEKAREAIEDYERHRQHAPGIVVEHVTPVAATTGDRSA